MRRVLFRRVVVEAKRCIAGRRVPATSYRATYASVGVLGRRRYREISVCFDSDPTSRKRDAA